MKGNNQLIEMTARTFDSYAHEMKYVQKILKMIFITYKAINEIDATDNMINKNDVLAIYNHYLSDLF